MVHAGRYLYPDGLIGGSWGRELLQVVLALVGEGGACYLVVAIVLNFPASVEVILPRFPPTQRQEVAGCGHLLD